MSLAQQNALTLGLVRLQQRGWKQGDYGKPKGPVCMVSALDNSDIPACRPLLKKAIQDKYGPHWNVNRWQDAKGRKFEEVEEIYIDAIQLAGAEK